MEYLKLQWNIPFVRQGTRKLFALGVYNNLTFLLKLFMNLFLLKSILHPSEDEAELHFKRVALAIIAALTIAPFGISHMLDYNKFNWKVGGFSRALLQKALLRKFLSCDPSSRKDLRDGILIMGVARDSQG